MKSIQKLYCATPANPTRFRPAVARSRPGPAPRAVPAARDGAPVHPPPADAPARVPAFSLPGRSRPFPLARSPFR